jgi:hypothetical protein
MNTATSSLAFSKRSAHDVMKDNNNKQKTKMKQSKLNNKIRTLTFCENPKDQIHIRLIVFH